MNAERRKVIQDCIGKLEDVQFQEQDAFDNMPDGLRDGDKGQAAERAIDSLQSALDALGDIE